MGTNYTLNHQQSPFVNLVIAIRNPVKGIYIRKEQEYHIQ